MTYTIYYTGMDGFDRKLHICNDIQALKDAVTSLEEDGAQMISVYDENDKEVEL